MGSVEVDEPDGCGAGRRLGAQPLSELEQAIYELVFGKARQRRRGRSRPGGSRRTCGRCSAIWCTSPTLGLKPDRDFS